MLFSSVFIFYDFLPVVRTTNMQFIFFIDARYTDIFLFIIVLNFPLLKIYHLNHFYCFFLKRKHFLVSMGIMVFLTIFHTFVYFTLLIFIPLHLPPLFCLLPFCPVLAMLSIYVCMHMLASMPVHEGVEVIVRLLPLSLSTLTFETGFSLILELAGQQVLGICLSALLQYWA